MKRKLTTGERGWLGLVVYIIAVDSIAWANQVKKKKKDETMSVAWGRWLQHPHSRALTGIAWAVVSLHLFLSFPLPGEKTLKNFVQGHVRKKLHAQGVPLSKMLPYNIRKNKKSYSVN